MQMPDKVRPSSFLAIAGPTILVEIEGVKGSTPRAAGTQMMVAETSLWETIGGGQLEFIAIDHARAMLRNGDLEDKLDITLGPEIGQCCGGRTLLRFKRMTAGMADQIDDSVEREQRSQPRIFIYGAGHVGKALAWSLSLLPLNVTVVETRKAEFEGLPPTVETKLTPMPESTVGDIPLNGAAIIVTHDHALDFLIAKEALARSDLAYVGMIGSKTKRATFTHWALQEGMDKRRVERLVLPIGSKVVPDKRPAVIAALVAAEILHAVSFPDTHAQDRPTLPSLLPAMSIENRCANQSGD